MPPQLERTVSYETLVLTEWKVAKKEDDIRAAFNEARKQAELYTGGVLAGVELAGYRYLVVLTKHQAPQNAVPDIETIDDIVYQHINIAIEPRTPSKESKRARKKAV